MGGGGNPEVLKGLVDANMMGRKSGKGMFVYAEGSKDRPVNQDALNIIKKFSLEAPAATGGDEDITLRLICGFVNEAIYSHQRDLGNPIGRRHWRRLWTWIPPVLWRTFQIHRLNGCSEAGGPHEKV